MATPSAAGRLIPRIFTSGRRKAEKSAADSGLQHGGLAAAASEQEDEAAKESEETKELSKGSEPPVIANMQPIRGKVKGNSIVPHPMSSPTRQSPSSALLEWKEGASSAAPTAPSATQASLQPIAHSHATAPSASSAPNSPSAPAASTVENLPPLRSIHTVGATTHPRLAQTFLPASAESATSAPTTPATTSAGSSVSLGSVGASEVNSTLPSSQPARLTPHNLLTPSSSAPSTERSTATLDAPSSASPSTSPSPLSTALSPTQSGASKSSHRTSIAQYIDYERRHAAEAQYHLHRKRQHQLKLQQSKQAGGAPDELQSLSVVYLPRGGIYVHTPAGPVQFGMPPETIKDSMSLGLTLPAFFVVPKERFNLAAGINVAEFEFPAYYNFFFKRRRINLITTHSVEPLIRTIFRETLLGPSKVDWPAEYGESVPKRCYPDLQKEMSFFSLNPFDKSPLTVDSLLAFTHFDGSGRVQLEQGVAIQDAGEEYVVTVGVQQDDGSVAEREIARVRQEVFSTPLLDDRERDRASAAAQHGSSKADANSAEYFVPPQFGLTMLGNSDGFDSTGTTTGFVLWMNRRGIMVDPPPHSGALLKRHGISARLMRGVILTHCFPASDTRVLTDHGFLFLEQIEALLAAKEEVLYGCYEVTKVVQAEVLGVRSEVQVHSKELKYCKGQLVFPATPPTHLVEFSSPDEDARCTEARGQYGTDDMPDDDERHVSLRVTPDHDMFVQTGSVSTHSHGVGWDSTLGVEDAYRKMPAQTLLSSDAHPHVRLLACAENGHQPHDTSRRDGVQAVLALSNSQFLAFLELLGFWLGDGCVSYDSSGDGCVRFDQVKKTELEWLREMFCQVGLQSSSWTVCQYGDTERVSIREPAWFAWFDAEFGAEYPDSHYGSVAIKGVRSNFLTTGLARCSSVSISSTDYPAASQSSGTSLNPTNSISSTSFTLTRHSRSTSAVSTVSITDAIAASDESEDDGVSKLTMQDDKTQLQPPAVDLSEPETVKSVKWLPDWMLTQLSRDEMRSLIAGVHRATVSYTGTAKAIHTSSARFRDQLMHALLHCGYSPHCDAMYTADTTLSYKLHTLANAHNTCSVASFNDLSAKGQLACRPVNATVDAWKVSWADVAHEEGRASCWPSMPRQRCINRVPYDAERDGRIWCVRVDHPDHLIVAQRAERDKQTSVVTKQSRPLVVGNCHADHDAGTFQKILEEGKVVLMTTEVILDSFIRKYSAISGLDAQFLRKLFVFRPVLVGQRTAVYGGHVEFFYSLHSIPCVGFSAYCLAEGTRVALANQTSVSIESFSTQAATSVLSYDATQNGCVNKTTEAPHLIYQGMKQCVELVLEDGRKLVCTSDHRLMTTRGEVKVEDLTQDDRVLVAPEGPLVNGGPLPGEVTWQLRFTLTHLGVSTRVTCPINQPDGYKRAMAFARLIGYVVTDGTIKAAGGVVTEGRFCMGHLLDAESIALDLAVVLGVHVKTINIGLPRGVQNCYYVDLPHRLAVSLHHEFGCPIGKRLGCGFGVPPILLLTDTPIDFIRECLGAMFGCDGGAPHYFPGGSKWGHIKFFLSVPSQQRAEAAMMLECEMLAALGLFGVTGTITEYKCKGELSTADTWQVVLNLPSEESLIFADNVGFRHCVHKQQRLGVAAGYYRGVQRRLDQKRRLVDDAIRAHRLTNSSWSVCIARVVAALRATEVVFDNVVESMNDNRMRAWAAGRDVVGNRGRGVYKTVKNYVNSIGAVDFFNEGHAVTGSRAHVYAVPRRMNYLPTWHLGVIGTRPVGMRRTYDLSVADTHLFVANGIIAHNCNGRSFVYSADSFNDPAGIRSLHEKGYVSEGRRDKLINFPWHHDLILHEAGVPPIHTPLATLEVLPDDVKQRLYIVHKPSKDVPADKGLKSALVGPQNTLLISADIPPNGRALEVLDLLSGIELFSGFDLSRALEILQCASFVEFNKGDTLIAEGTYGNAGGPPCMYVIAMGTVAIEQDGQHIKQLTVGDHFGEMSIITGEKRTASVKALTPVEVIQFSKQEFLYIVRHTDAISRLQQLGVIQRSPSWQAISANSALSQLSSAQKTYLQSLFVHRLVEQGDTVWQAGDPATEAVLIADGQFYFSRAKEQPPFTRGALVGEMRALIAATTLSATLQCAESGSVFAITRPQLCKFFDDNPGVQILFMNRRFIE